jgi:CarD family transcriptional regulator
VVIGNPILAKKDLRKIPHACVPVANPVGGCLHRDAVYGCSRTPVRDWSVETEDSHDRGLGSAARLPFPQLWATIFECCPSVLLRSQVPLMLSGDSIFHIGDKVVYPNHGVGVIEQISSRTIGATVEKFYLLKIKASSLKVMVPFHNVNSVGLRRVVKNGEIQKILDFLTDGECLNNADWKDRFKENSEKMRTGSLLEVAVVLKGLLVLNQTKPLSFREKKMLERARYLLVSELAMAKNVEERIIEQILAKALTKCKLRFPEAAEFEA